MSDPVPYSRRSPMEHERDVPEIVTCGYCGLTRPVERVCSDADEAGNCFCMDTLHRREPNA